MYLAAYSCIFRCTSITWRCEWILSLLFTKKNKLHLFDIRIHSFLINHSRFNSQELEFVWLQMIFSLELPMLYFAKFVLTSTLLLIYYIVIPVRYPGTPWRCTVVTSSLPECSRSFVTQTLYNTIHTLLNTLTHLRLGLSFANQYRDIFQYRISLSCKLYFSSISSTLFHLSINNPSNIVH